MSSWHCLVEMFYFFLFQFHSACCYVDMCVEVRGHPWHVCPCLLPCLRQGFLLSTVVYARLSSLWVSRKHPPVSVFHLSLVLITNSPYNAWPYLGSKEPESSDPQSCKTNTLPPEPSPLLQFEVFSPIFILFIYVYHAILSHLPIFLNVVLAHCVALISY